MEPSIISVLVTSPNGHLVVMLPPGQTIEDYLGMGFITFLATNAPKTATTN
jgi:hypothetical protein